MEMLVRKWEEAGLAGLWVASRNVGNCVDVQTGEGEHAYKSQVLFYLGIWEP